MAETIRVARDGDVVELVLSRPEALNAVSQQMVQELRQAFEGMSGARAVLLRGAGRAFSAGRDLSEYRPDEDAASVLRQSFNALCQQLATLPAPTIAAVQGICTGLGLSMALACDVVLAADSAALGVSQTKLGAIADAGGHYHLVRGLGYHRAMELIYSGQCLTGEEAAALGLVNRTVPADELVQTARALAQQVAAGPTAAFRISKRIAQTAREQAFTHVLDLEASGQAQASKTTDFGAAYRAHQMKMSMKFKGA